MTRQTKKIEVRRVVPLTVLACLVIGVMPGQARTLEGNVQEDDAITRLARPSTQQGGVQDNGASLRVQRPMAAMAPSGLKGLVDTNAFSRPLTGNAQDNGGRLGLMKPSFDKENSKFDLGADRNSRELTLAWEAWHHQLSQEIYQRWSDVATMPGEATMRITVTRNHQIMPMIVRSSGNPHFDRILVATIMSLNGNPGLTFPSKSERQQVTFEADYMAATDITPGFSWVKNDYEKIRQDY